MTAQEGAGRRRISPDLSSTTGDCQQPFSNGHRPPSPPALALADMPNQRKRRRVVHGKSAPPQGQGQWEDRAVNKLGLHGHLGKCQGVPTEQLPRMQGPVSHGGAPAAKSKPEQICHSDGVSTFPPGALAPLPE